MTAQEKLEIIGAIMVATGYPYEYLTNQSNEKLLEIYKQRVEQRV
ncbi:hypothetical protein SLL00_03550 [Metabacillus indicus]|nr:hypothetical protein [Metabacillus indicus]MDX8288849.1 hypothetical protein [Metabacillus indicus]